MNRFFLSIIGLMAYCFSGCGQHSLKQADADDFERIISSKDVQLVDVRTKEEFDEAHINIHGVMNIDFKQPDFKDKALRMLDKKHKVAVYCRSGRRSAEAAKTLRAEGFNVTDLKGGIIEWQKRGKATQKEAAPD